MNLFARARYAGGEPRGMAGGFVTSAPSAEETRGVSTEPRDPVTRPVPKPRVGFLGVGWIGRHRLQAVAEAGLVEIAGLADPVHDNVTAGIALAPSAERGSCLEDMLALDLDAIVIATPSAMHADQCVQAIERGLHVFCQKPLGRNAAEVRRVVEAARDHNRLLGVDLSYRHLSGAQKIRELIRAGELGQVYAVDVVFHNAYGPDKAWFYDPKLSGGGCVVDLGIHLVDLALWSMEFPRVEKVSSRLFVNGAPLRDRTRHAEDYATARIDLANDATVHMDCSWKLHAGCDARIEAAFYGTHGGAILRNVNGSFYDFECHLCRGTAREQINTPNENWGGAAAVQWARQLVEEPRFDHANERLVQVAETLDAIYEL